MYNRIPELSITPEDVYVFRYLETHSSISHACMSFSQSRSSYVPVKQLGLILVCSLVMA